MTVKKFKKGEEGELTEREVYERSSGKSVFEKGSRFIVEEDDDDDSNILVVRFKKSCGLFLVSKSKVEKVS